MRQWGHGQTSIITSTTFILVGFLLAECRIRHLRTAQKLVIDNRCAMQDVYVLLFTACQDRNGLAFVDYCAGYASPG
jgi:hypothetical protein